MKFLSSFCLGLLLFNTVAAVDDSRPEVYIDISRRAQLNAVRFDGWKLVAGLAYSMASFEACTKTTPATTERSLNNFMLTAGVDYSKKFKNKYLLGVSVLADFWKAQKKTGDWKAINQSYDTEMEGKHSYSDKNMAGEIKIPFIIPEIAVKGGYIFRNLGTVAFIKLGAQYLQSEYIYYGDGIKFDSVKNIKLIPTLGIGGFKRFNKKFGISFEWNFPLFKSYNEKIITHTYTPTGQSEPTTINITHRVKMGRSTIRVLATYNVPR